MRLNCPTEMTIIDLVPLGYALPRRRDSRSSSPGSLRCGANGLIVLARNFLHKAAGIEALQRITLLIEHRVD